MLASSCRLFQWSFDIADLGAAGCEGLRCSSHCGTLLLLSLALSYLRFSLKIIVVNALWNYAILSIFLHIASNRSSLFRRFKCWMGCFQDVLSQRYFCVTEVTIILLSSQLLLVTWAFFTPKQEWHLFFSLPPSHILFVLKSTIGSTNIVTLVSKTP